MATEKTVQVIPTSADVAGMSVVTASANERTLRSGLIYNTATLAAATPVWFHPMQDGSHLTLFSRRLTDATLADRVSARGLLLYRSGTVVTDPFWGIISPRTGVISDTAPVPSEQPGTRIVTGAFSRGDYLFVLNQHKTSEDADPQSLLQYFRVTVGQGITLLGEELVPLDMRLGLYVDRRYLWVFGVTKNNNLGMIRKSWSRIGLSPDAATTPGWQFWGDKRWNESADKITGLAANDGLIPAHGPCSMARYRDTYYLFVTVGVVYPAVHPALPATTTPAADLTATRRKMFPLLRGLIALIGGVLQGFVRLGVGTVRLIINILRKIIQVITGTAPDTDDTAATPLVEDFLDTITGNYVPDEGEDMPDPAVQFENIIRAITGDTDAEDPTETGDSQDFLDGMINEVTGQEQLTAPDKQPVTLLERIIRNITAVQVQPTIVSDINDDDIEDTVTRWTNPTMPVRAVSYTNIDRSNPGGRINGVVLSADDLVYLNGQNTATENGLYRYVAADLALQREADQSLAAAQIPQPSWKVLTYSSRAVEDRWTRHGFVYDLAPTTSLYQGGAYLQEQIPLTPGFGVIPSSAEVALLDDYSSYTQVVTGNQTHTVVLPGTAKPVGSSVSTEGVIDIPVSPIEILPLLSIEDASVTEGQLGPKTVTFRVTLDKATLKKVTVSYATFDATATGGGEDYKTVTGVLTFEPGILSQEVSAVIYGDNTYEEDETFTVELFDPVNAEIDDDTAICTVVNDDQETLLESLMDDFRNIVKGLIKGALQVSGLLVKTVMTILKQTVSTMTEIVEETGSLLYSLVDSFLNKVSGGRWDIPGESTPAENLAEIFHLIGKGFVDTWQEIKDFATDFIDSVRSTIQTVTRAVVNIVQRLIRAIFNRFIPGGSGGAAAMSMMSMSPALMSAQNDAAAPISYLPYTIHNQSTADIVVMAADRDRAITVPHGIGYVFTPYKENPSVSTDWSWTYASERAPRIRQGFPFVHTRKVAVGTYYLGFSGQPGGGYVRLSHNGYVTGKIEYKPGNPTGTVASILSFLPDLKSLSYYTVTPADDDGTLFRVEIPDDCDYLNVYSYRFLNGALTPVVVNGDGDDPDTIAYTGPPDVKSFVYKRFTLSFSENTGTGEFFLDHNGLTHPDPILFGTDLVPVLDLLDHPTDDEQWEIAPSLDAALSALAGVRHHRVVFDPESPHRIDLYLAADGKLNELSVESATLTRAAGTPSTDPDPVLDLIDDYGFTLHTSWSALEPNPQPAAPSGLAKAEDTTVAVTDPDRLSDLMGQFAAVVRGLTSGSIQVGLGVVDTINVLLTEAVFIITGKEVAAVRNATNQFIEFVQELSREGAVTNAAVANFETALRLLVGGTGLSQDDDSSPSQLMQDAASPEVEAAALASKIGTVVQRIAAQ